MKSQKAKKDSQTDICSRKTHGNRTRTKQTNNIQL